jgi:glycosyltransferase involved in cell wall biosynthesis
LVSDCAPLKRIVEQAQCGCVFTASNRQAFQERLIWMYHHQDQLTIMGEQGRHAALNRYAWRHDARTLVNLYERLKLAHTFVSN